MVGKTLIPTTAVVTRVKARAAVAASQTQSVCHPLVTLGVGVEGRRCLRLRTLGTRPTLLLRR